MFKTTNSDKEGLEKYLEGILPNLVLQFVIYEFLKKSMRGM